MSVFEVLPCLIAQLAISLEVDTTDHVSDSITYRERGPDPAPFWHAHTDLGSSLSSFVADFTLSAFPAVSQTLFTPDL